MSTFLQEAITFFAIMDPIGISAVALSILSTNITKSEINKVASKTTITIVIAFFVVIIAGEFVLKVFGLDINSLKVMGGLVLLLMALSMISGNTKFKADGDDKQNEELAVIPIAIPIVFGTGLFSTIIIFKHEAKTFLDLFSISLAYCLNAVIFYLIFKNSIHIKKLLGVTGQNIITKLMGLIVGALAIQFVVSGIISLAKVYI
ncbi:antibiotic resistance protein MarC [Arcobacter sp. CECT 8986]|uniref:MarC family protein n=1 Tax=Arcobacter sp. CECT 8986 TaxID=2044507 RepID=UPI001009921A|nr:MarC family protein [Arcobacter sp. CECT 8986]RXJ97883.1 antibiotic resistance protein MarC [Arcobacter sp. CECT 8986]